jgi:hypothetical protein
MKVPQTVYENGSRRVTQSSESCNVFNVLIQYSYIKAIPVLQGAAEAHRFVRRRGSLIF